MRIPLSWLQSFVEVPASARALADQLTFAGIEVEAIETIGSTYEQVVVAEVRAVEPHPNADKLRVCQVFDGLETLQVVCGAPNVTVGGHYPFARIGASLLKGTLNIKKAKLRGVESFGMLCSADELGLPNGPDGLLTLEARPAPGTPIADVLGPPETVFTIEITPNRPDCISLIGVAREIAALTRKPLQRPIIPHHTGGSPAAPIDVQDASACPRYTVRKLTGVRVGPSPDWMRRRLEHAGIRSINNVVDITNYVMLETGHPLHAFDAARLAGGTLSVRHAREGERIHTLDGVDRALTPDMLVIADARHPVALAGIMGGEGSGIDHGTTTVLLESACFAGNSIRATARALGLSTDSSYRFERGVDPETVADASDRAAALMAELAGATIDAGWTDLYPAPRVPRHIPLRPQRVRDIVGVDASDEVIAECLTALGLEVRRTGAAFEVGIPSHRADLESEIDLIEEFSRIHGLEAIPTRPSRAAPEHQADDRLIRAQSALRHQLAGMGLREVVHYTLVAPALLDLFDRNDATARVVLPRPVTADQSVLRTSLVPQMLETLGRNRAHQLSDAGLFEIGRIFRASGGTIEESTRLCAGLMGPLGRPELQRRAALRPEEMFLWAKGILMQLTTALKRPTPTLAETTCAWAEPGLAFRITGPDGLSGILGLVRASIRREWRLHEPVAVLDLDPAALLTERRPAACQPLPVHPSTDRDVALIGPESLRHAEVEAVIREAAPRELESIRLFDIFRGDAIGKDRKSLAYALTYRSADRTLTDEEANAFHDRVKKALKDRLGVELRES